MWIITSCLGLANETAAYYNNGLVTPEIEKEYYRVRGELYSLCRAKVIWLQNSIYTVNRLLMFVNYIYQLNINK